MSDREKTVLGVVDELTRRATSIPVWTQEPGGEGWRIVIVLDPGEWPMPQGATGGEIAAQLLAPVGNDVTLDHVGPFKQPFRAYVESARTTWSEGTEQ